MGKPVLDAINQEEKITFSFGENWKNYLTTVNVEDLKAAQLDINEWLGEENVQGKRIIDIGSGSGIHSYVLHIMRAKELVSIDYDINSVDATTKMWEKAGKPGNWKIRQGSILDQALIDQLGTFDIVYSWGVLHHTGSMWKAIQNSIKLLNESGIYWISIYQKGPGYYRDLKLKRKFNAASDFGKNMMIYRFIIKIMLCRLLNGKNPFKWNQKVPRGMNVYNDIIDWLGGLPYEVATKAEIVEFSSTYGLKLLRSVEVPEGGCSIYLFSR